MRIRIDLSAPPVRPELTEPDDFRAFDVLLSGDGARSEALSGLGPVGPVGADGEHVFVEPARLLELAGERAEDPEWRAGLAAMTAFAAEQGWVDDEGRIRAHVVTPE